MLFKVWQQWNFSGGVFGFWLFFNSGASIDYLFILLYGFSFEVYISHRKARAPTSETSTHEQKREQTEWVCLGAFTHSFHYVIFRGFTLLGWFSALRYFYLSDRINTYDFPMCSSTMAF